MLRKDERKEGINLKQNKNTGLEQKQKEEKKKRIEEYCKILECDNGLYETTKRCLETHQPASFEEEIYYTVLAPAMLTFIRWVLTRAEQLGKKRLYFLARDGYPMYLAAKSICSAEGISIECKYLYASRYAWRIPQFFLEEKQCLNKICLGGIDVTFERIMLRAGLSREEGKQIAAELGRLESYHVRLSYPEVKKLKEPLQKSERFLSLVYHHSRETYQDTVGYLKQEGLFDDIPYALVDSGWTGTMQATLQELLARNGYQNDLEGFYFGLYEIPAGVAKRNYHAFYFTPGSGLKRKVYFSNCLFECVFSAPHGMTVGYAKVGQQYIPKLNREENCNQEKMENASRWLEGYLQEYQACGANSFQHRPYSRGISFVWRLFKRFMGRPLIEEVEEYGNYLFSDDVMEDYVKKIAAELSEKEIKSQRFLHKLMLMTGIKKGAVQDSAWIEGSIVRNGKQIKQNLRHAVCYKYAVYIRKWLKRGLK